MSNEFDVLIKNATIVDGTGKAPFKGSIGISKCLVEAVGEVKGDADEVLDAKDLTATPGFIDAHSHADDNILFYPKCENYVMQGVTTFVGGNCGKSPAPLGEMVRVPSLLAVYLDQLDPHKYYPKPLYPLEQVNAWMEEKYGWTIDWKTMDGYFKRVEEKGISANYAPLVGHGNARFMVMGMDYKRYATQEEVNQMIEYIHQAMKEGCLGLSTGMDYDPDIFASQDEIIQSVAVLKEYDGVYHPHWRRTGRRRDVMIGARTPGRINGIKECIEVCRRTGVRLHFAHFHAGYEIKPKATPRLEEAAAKATLDVIDQARDEGLDISFNYIPSAHNERCLVPMPYLCSLLTPWIRETGSPERLAECLKMEDYREDVKKAIFAGKWHIRLRHNPNVSPDWAERIIVLKYKKGNYDGKSIAEIAALREREQLDTLFDLVSEDPYTRAAYIGIHLINESREQEKVFLKDPKVSVCLDKPVYDDKYQGERPPYYLPKALTYSGFISVLIKYVQKQKIFSIEEAVRKMSTNGAEVHKLKGRGMLKPGYYADIVLLDISNLKVMGDELEPRCYPRGIEYVFVNGTKVVEKGKHTGARSGMVLRRI